MPLIKATGQQKSIAPPGSRFPSYEPLGMLMLVLSLQRLLSTPPNQSSGYLQGQSLGSDSKPATLQPAPTDPEVVNTYLHSEVRSMANRQCTVCLDPRGEGEGSRGAVAVTECGHAFCWSCLGSLEKAECPLCRQALRSERLIAACNL